MSYSDWSKTIQSIKLTETRYFLKEDTEKKRPFKYSGTTVDFYDENKVFVNFYCQKEQNEKVYQMPIEEFSEKFYAVEE